MNELVAVNLAGTWNYQQLTLPAINVAKARFIEVAIFFQLNTNFFFPFLNVHGSIEFDGVGGVVMQWIISGVWNATLHIPHANGGAGCMPVKPDGVRVYRRGNALLNSLLSRFRQYLISCLTYFEVTG